MSDEQNFNKQRKDTLKALIFNNAGALLLWIKLFNIILSKPKTTSK